MKTIKIKRAGGYNPKLGPKHPDNQDPTLIESALVANELRRTIRIAAEAEGEITVAEFNDDETYVTVASSVGAATVCMTAEQLWRLAAGIVELFGGTVLRYDDERDRATKLREKIFDVLVDNEARCLDDNIDRDVVLVELMKALS